jgi:hypothetical protein
VATDLQYREVGRVEDYILVLFLEMDLQYGKVGKVNNHIP